MNEYGVLEFVPIIVLAVAIFTVALLQWMIFRAYFPRGSNELEKPARETIERLLLSLLAILLLSLTFFAYYKFYKHLSLHESSITQFENILEEKLPNRSTQNRKHKEILKAINQAIELSTRSKTTHKGQEGLDLHRIEKLLKKSLPNPPTQDRRHQETLEAIKNLESSINSLAGGGSVSISFFSISFISLLVFGSLWCIAKFQVNPPRTLGFAVVGALLTSSFAVIDDVFNFSLVESWSLTLFSITDGTVSSKAAIGPKVDISIAAPSGVAVTCSEKYSIGPFVTGKVDELDDNQTLTEKVQQLVNQLTADSTSGKPVLLILIGSSDRRPLTSKLARLYGSNAGLAQARALRVETLLEQQFKVAAPTMLALSTGPSVTIDAVASPEDTDGQVLESDRSVHLCSVFSSA